MIKTTTTCRWCCYICCSSVLVMLLVQPLANRFLLSFIPLSNLSLFLFLFFTSRFRVRAVVLYQKHINHHRYQRMHKKPHFMVLQMATKFTSTNLIRFVMCSHVPGPLVWLHNYEAMYSILPLQLKCNDIIIVIIFIDFLFTINSECTMHNEHVYNMCKHIDDSDKECIVSIICLKHATNLTNILDFILI